MTTTAAAIAAVAEDALLVELDPAGGDLECWTGVSDEPGLIRIAQQMRRSRGPEAAGGCATEGPAGVDAILAPTSGPLAETTIAAVEGLVGSVLPALERNVVVIDGGRWSASQVAAKRLTGCDVVGVVCRPTVAGVEAARWLLEPLEAVARAPVVVVLVGEHPYSAGEVERVVGMPVVAVLPWDPRAVRALMAAVTPRHGWTRTRLARSARAGLERLGRHTQSWEVAADA